MYALALFCERACAFHGDGKPRFPIEGRVFAMTVSLSPNVCSIRFIIVHSAHLHSVLIAEFTQIDWYKKKPSGQKWDHNESQPGDQTLLEKPQLRCGSIRRRSRLRSMLRIIRKMILIRVVFEGHRFDIEIQLPQRLLTKVACLFN